MSAPFGRGEFASIVLKACMSWTSLIVLMGLVAGMNCPAQAESPTEQLQRFGAKMVGGTWSQELPEAAGKKHTYKWGLHNRFLLVYMRHESEPNALAVVGVDPKTNLQTWWTFQDDGAIRITAADVELLTPTRDKVVIHGPNAVRQGVFETAWTDDDTLEIAPQSGATTDGELAVQERWRRSQDVDDISAINADGPVSYTDQFWLARRVTGKMWIDGIVGTKFIGAGYGKWILKGKFHIFTGSVTSEDQTSWTHLLITGIDPATKQAASWEFSSDGAKNDITFDESGKKIRGVGMQPDGSRHEFAGKFYADGETLRYRSKIAVDGGDALPYGWNYRKAD